MTIFLILAFIFATLEWFSEYKEFRTGIFVAKPAVMICLIVWVLTYSDFSAILSNPSSFPLVWFVVGLVFCLAGDIFLMWRDRFFLPGLISFLVGHVFYIVGFKRILPPEGTWVPGIILMIMVVVVSGTVYQKLAQGMAKSGKVRMRIPVAVYAVIISVMLYGALMTLLNDVWHFTPAIWITSGALLFYLSDIMNAWVEFYAPLPNARFKIMTTYHLGQIAITLGAALHYSSMVT